MLTIMTEPLSLYYRSRVYMRKFIRKIPNNYGGHYSVTRSLFDGFDRIDFKEYNYRPSMKNIGEHVHVLSGISTLNYALELRKKGIIKRITTGPNTIAFPDEQYYEQLKNPNIDLILFPSKMNADYFCRYIPELRGKVRAFASGINEEEFIPIETKRKYVLIYSKNVDNYWGDYISYILEKHAFKPYIIRYGSYNLDEYKRILNRSKFMISLSKHDTQGIYLAEAWAMDCPTICFNSHFCSFPSTATYVEGNQIGSPYVCEENGALFDSITELEKIISEYEIRKQAWHPREYVLKHMTDSVCSQHFLDLVLG